MGALGDEDGVRSDTLLMTRLEDPTDVILSQLAQEFQRFLHLSVIQSSLSLGRAGGQHSTWPDPGA